MTPSRTVQQAINRRAHAMSRQAYAQTRVELMAEAGRMRAAGATDQDIVTALCTRDARTREDQGVELPHRERAQTLMQGRGAAGKMLIEALCDEIERLEAECNAGGGRVLAGHPSTTDG